MASGPIPGSSSASLPSAPSSVPGGPSAIPGSFGPTRLRGSNGRFVKGGFGYQWQNLEELINLPERFRDSLIGGVTDHLTALADEMEAYAKDNAPWEDRTGDARDGLKAVLIPRGEVFEINLGYSVQYGYYLENAHGGVFATVAPTVRLFQGKLTDYADKVQERFDRIH